MRCIGLMSGTSIDGVDGILAEFDPQGRLLRSEALISLPMPAGLRDTLTRLQAPVPDELRLAALAANDLTDLYATCVREVLATSATAPADVAALGAHGQTIRHDPANGYTIQLLNGARLAEQTGIAVACDLRSADIAAGGQGAPLVPVFHARVFAPARGKRRGIVNIGGIANLTVLETASDGSTTVAGFDTGPGNTLLDSWCERHLGQRYDRDGAWAAQGQCLPGLLARLLDDPYFRADPPKSTGRDHFNLAWLDAALKAFGTTTPDQAAPKPADVQATLLALTARSIADAINAAGLTDIHVCGGGVANPMLMAALRAASGPAATVQDTMALGMHPQAVEATAFAWLARQRITARPGNLPSVTGARSAVVLGALYAGPASRP